MVLTNGTFGVIGGGVMGQALMKGLIDKGVLRPDQIWAASRTEASCQKVTDTLGVEALIDYAPKLANTQVLLICVKPSGVAKVLELLKQSALPESAVVMSIAAGVTLDTLEEALDSNNPVIRAMPNTPAIVGQGMTVVCGGSHTNKTHLALAKEIFSAVGTCMQLDESHFDAVTGLSGSGPAYVYLVIEALADGGVRVGLPRDVAMKLVTQTVLGAATMVQKSGRHPAALRDDVTTPAGCTIGALLAMEDGKIRSVLARAVEEAAQIAGQLGKPAPKK